MTVARFASVVGLLWLALASQFATATRLKPPLEDAEYKQLTRHDQLLQYVRRLVQSSELVFFEIIGRSVEHRDIPALFFTTDDRFGQNRAKKPLVLIYAQQHGDEPAGKEGALLAARELVGPRNALLEQLDLILVPQVNPDGAEANRRVNARGADLNRDHVMLVQPETLALHQLFLQWMPEVTVDLHEYNVSQPSWFAEGFIVDADLMIDRVTNLNIAVSLREFSDELFLPQLFERLGGHGTPEKRPRVYRYPVGGPPSKKRLRHSTLNINDGRQSMGVYNTLSFIVEGTQYSDVSADLRRRAQGQSATILAFLEIIAENRRQVIDRVSTARKLLTARSTFAEDPSQPRRIAIRMDYAPDSQRPTLENFPIFDLHSWRPATKDLDNYEPQVETQLTVEKPFGYVIPASEKRLLKLLARHRIRGWRLPEDSRLRAETYTITNVSNSNEEDKPSEKVAVHKKSSNRLIHKGAMIVPLAQQAGIALPLMLEPQSSWSICTTRSGRQQRFADYLKVGTEYPVLRLLQSPGTKFKPSIIP